MIDSYLDNLREVVTGIDINEYEAVKKLLIDSSSQAKNLFLLGEGINSAVADHFAVDLTKNVGLSLGNSGFSIKTIAMNQPMPLLTALANDVCQEMVYAEQLRLLAVPGDLLVIFAEGLKLDSIKNAITYAHNNGIKVALISADITPEMKEMSDAFLNVKSPDSYIIQDLLLFLSHALTDNLMHEMKYPVVFLDRDGVINIDSDDYIKSVSEFQLIDGSAEAIKLLNLNGYAVVVVTNQAIIGRGIATVEAVEEINEHMTQELLKRGAKINKIYYCPHAPEENCNCRKPKPGLIQKAFEELPLDESHAFMIGDRKTDIEAGVNAGVPNIFIGSKEKLGKEEQDGTVYYAENLFDAVTWLICQK